jgi:hypothetical protein
MKTCAQAIAQPLMEWDSNYDIKQGYESTLKDVTQDLSRELGRVAKVNSSDKQRLSDLVKQAAKLWLEAGQQRCRMFMLMSEPGSGDVPKRSGSASLDSDHRQSLVVFPALRRLGNSQGERLDKDEVVMDCNGQFSVFLAA